MASRRVLIVEALIAALNSITVENGYNTSIGTAGGFQVPSRDANIGAVLPFGIVHVPREDKADDRVVDQMDCRLYVDVLVAPFSAEDGIVEEDIEQLVEDVERVILDQKAQEPPLGVAGVLDLEYGGHEKLPLRGDLVFSGASMQVVVHYRHDVTDPRTYMGSAT
jgi:hypothetical protein